ncbi:MAG TPA: hypothetical protein VI365_21625, partial [Trebonia sp.]
MPAVRANDLFDAEGSGDGLDPSVTRPARMGDLSLEASGLAPKRSFGRRVRDFLGGTSEYAEDEREDNSGADHQEPQEQEPGEQYA